MLAGRAIVHRKRAKVVLGAVWLMLPRFLLLLSELLGLELVSLSPEEEGDN